MGHQLSIYRTASLFNRTPKEEEATPKSFNLRQQLPGAVQSLQTLLRGRRWAASPRARQHPRRRLSIPAPSARGHETPEYSGINPPSNSGVWSEEDSGWSLKLPCPQAGSRFDPLHPHPRGWAMGTVPPGWGQRGAHGSGERRGWGKRHLLVPLLERGEMISVVFVF